MKKTLRQTLQYYLMDSSTLLGKLIDVFILLLNIILCVIFVAETHPISEFFKSFLWNLEVITVFILIIEYFLRLYSSPFRLKQVFSFYSIIDLITILPTVIMFFIPVYSVNLKLMKMLRIIRILRVFRIIRFLRFMSDPNFFFGTITVYLLKLFRLMFTIFIIFFISSGLFFYAESGTNPQIQTFGDAFYFSVITLTTVGFGDIVPVSQSGRWTVILIVISGIVLIPWQASQIIKEWFNVSKKHVTCTNCGLKFHETDASHCKSCGNIIYQEYDGT